MTSAPVREGDIVSGKYAVGRVLGAGGMGVVVLATQIELDRPVALKFLLREAASFPEVSARFAREARASAKIRSEHVVRVLDVGALDEGTPYIVMEYLEGEDLQDMLTRRGVLPIVEAVDYLLEACEALAEAHALGIVHRDLKPANLFLARRPNGRAIVKVLDFGIAKAAPAANDSRLTNTWAVFGSPLYMSPEQMTSSTAVGPGSDIWSLGITLYELLTGRHAFDGDTKGDLVAAVLRERPLTPRAHRPEIAPELEATILRCIEKDPAARFPHVAALAAALAAFASPASIQAVERISHALGIGMGAEPNPPRSLDVRASAAPTRMDAASTNAPLGAPRRSRWRAASRAAGMAAIAGVSAFGASRLVQLSWADSPPIPSRVVPASAAPSRAESATTTGANGLELAPGSLPVAAGGARSSAPAAQQGAASAPLPAAVRPPAHASATGVAAALAPAAFSATKAPECARLLERLSLGETLSAAESRSFARLCRDARTGR